MVTKDKRHHHQAGNKRKHPLDDKNCDGDDRFSVTAGHEFFVTVNDEDDLSLYYKHVEKREGQTPEEEQVYEFRYHDLVSVTEDDLDSPIEQRFAEVCPNGVMLKTMKNLRQNLKALLFLRIAFL